MSFAWIISIFIVLISAYMGYKPFITKFKNYIKSKVKENRRTIYFDNKYLDDLGKDLFYRSSNSRYIFSRLFEIIGSDYRGHEEIDIPYFSTINIETVRGKIKIIEKNSLFKIIIGNLLIFAFISLLVFGALGYFKDNSLEAKIVALIFIFLLLPILIINLYYLYQRRWYIFKNKYYVRGVVDNISKVYIDRSSNREKIIPFEEILGFVVAYKELKERRDKRTYRYGFFTLDMVLKSGRVIILNNYTNKREPIDDDSRVIADAMKFSKYTNRPIFYIDDYKR